MACFFWSMLLRAPCQRLQQLHHYRSKIYVCVSCAVRTHAAQSLRCHAVMCIRLLLHSRTHCEAHLLSRTTQRELACAPPAPREGNKINTAPGAPDAAHAASCNAVMLCRTRQRNPHSYHNTQHHLRRSIEVSHSALQRAQNPVSHAAGTSQAPQKHNACKSPQTRHSKQPRHRHHRSAGRAQLMFISVGLKLQKQHASNAQQIMKQLPAHPAHSGTLPQW